MPKIVVEGPDGKKYAFPDTMPREEINAFMKQRYGTKARNETVQDYLARVVREQDATKARAKSVTKEATAAGRAEGERAAERMGVDNPLMMAFAAPAIGLAQQSAGRTVYDREGTMLPDEAAALAAVNAAGFFVPGMVNKQFGERAAEGRRQQPGATFAGDLAGGMIGGEAINLGLQKVGQAVAPAVSQIGRLFKGKPAAAAPEPPMVLGPESRILPVDRPDALPGDDVAMAQALDAWTPPVEQQVRPMGFGADTPKKPAPFEAPGSPEYEAAVAKGLPMDQASRIARAQEAGYNTDQVWYHGTRSGNDIASDGGFKLGVGGSGGADQGNAIFMSASPDVAGKYAGSAGQVIPSYVRGKIKPVPLSEVRAADGGFDGDAMLRAINKGRKEGFSGLVVKGSDGAADELVIFDPANIRSVNAAFDPDKAASSVLMAGQTAKPSLLTERGRDAVEQTFGAAYMSGTGSVAGGEYDLNGDGQIDNTDRAIGSAIGLAAFASPLAFRKVAELGGRLKGTKAPTGGDDINPAGFTGPGGYSMKSAVETPEEDIIKWADENVTVKKPRDGETVLKIKSSETTDSGAPRTLNDVTIRIDRAYAPNVRERGVGWSTDYSADGVYVDMSLSGRFSKDGASSAKDVAKASRVFSKAIGALRAYAAKEKPKFITFSGATKDHEKLYSYLLENYQFPGYKFYVQTKSGAMKAIDENGAAAVWQPVPQTKFYLVREDLEGTIDPARLRQRGEIIESGGRERQVVSKDFEGLEPGGRR